MNRTEKIKALNALAKGDTSLLERMQPEKPLFVNYIKLDDNKFQLVDFITNEPVGETLTKAEIDTLEKKLLNQKQMQLLGQIN